MVVNYLAKTKYILIKNNYLGKESLYFDLTSGLFIKREEKTPAGMYVLTVLLMVMSRSIKNERINGNFFFFLATGVCIGVGIGYIFQVIDQYFKSCSGNFKEIENDRKYLIKYLKVGQLLLSNQIKIISVVSILCPIAYITFYFKQTLLNFFLVILMTFAVVALLNFSSPFKKKKVFQEISRKIK